MSRGFAVFGQVVVLFLSIFFLSFFMSQRTDQSQIMRRRSSTKAYIETLIYSIEAALKSQQSYIKTVKSSLNKNGADLEQCLNNPAFDCPIGVYPFSLLDDLGNVIIDSASSSAGFNLSYVTCSTFDAVPPAGCVYRYEMTWQPTCAAAPCFNPQIQVNGRLIIQTNEKGAVNMRTNEYDTSFNLR